VTLSSCIRRWVNFWWLFFLCACISLCLIKLWLVKECIGINQCAQWNPSGAWAIFPSPRRLAAQLLHACFSRCACYRAHSRIMSQQLSSSSHGHMQLVMLCLYCIELSASDASDAPRGHQLLYFECSCFPDAVVSTKETKRRKDKQQLHLGKKTRWTMIETWPSTDYHPVTSLPLSLDSSSVLFEHTVSKCHCWSLNLKHYLCPCYTQTRRSLPSAAGLMRLEGVCPLAAQRTWRQWVGPCQKSR